MSDYVSLYSALSGLLAAQAGIDTASHNVANATTPGYSRQRTEQASRYPHTTRIGQVGQGVDVVDLTRARDAFLDARFRSSAAMYGRSSTTSELLQRAEAALGEPDSGITATLGDLWAKFGDLSNDPEDPAARVAVLDALDRVAGSVRSVAESFDALAASAARELGDRVGEVNGLLRELGDLNRSILEASSDFGTPNDLLDKRDLAIDRLAELVGVTVTDTGNGTVRVSVSGLGLVDGTHVSELSHDAATSSVVHSSGHAVAPGGVLGGYQGFLSTELPAYRTQLDTFATDLATALNAQHGLGFSASGPGGPLFSYDPARPAATLTVAIGDPTKLATASSPGPPFPVFDGSNADLLAAVRHDLVAAGGTLTLDASMRSLIADIGSATAVAIRNAESQQALQQAAEFDRQNISGVSVDEEMVSLITYQRAYEAAARVMTTVDQTLDTLINRTGIVGR